METRRSPVARYFIICLTIAILALASYFYLLETTTAEVQRLSADQSRQIEARAKGTSGPAGGR